MHLAFEPTSCAVALSLIERVIVVAAQRCTASAATTKGSACPRAKVWLLRRAPHTLTETAINEASEPTLDALNAIDRFYYSFLSSSHNSGSSNFHHLHHDDERAAVLSLCAALIFALFVTAYRAFFLDIKRNGVCVLVWV